MLRIKFFQQDTQMFFHILYVLHYANDIKNYLKNCTFKNSFKENYDIFHIRVLYKIDIPYDKLSISINLLIVFEVIK